MRTIGVYELRVLCPDEAPAEEGSAFKLEQEEQRVLKNLPGLLLGAEEDLSDLLPEGWRVTIKESRITQEEPWLKQNLK